MIAVVHTRELCYFSADFFLNHMTEALENAGEEVLRLPVGEGEDFSALEELLALEKAGKGPRLILDMNSRLPYLVDDDGERWLNKFSCPFINYIVDHPLYHHPGLFFKLNNYHVITVDDAHREYVQRFYPHIKTVDFKTIPGTLALLAIPLEERRKELYFSGTNLPEEEVIEEIEKLDPLSRKIIWELSEIWDFEHVPLEYVLEEYLENEKARLQDFLEENRSSYEIKNDMVGLSLLREENFPVLMNRLFALDRLMRYRFRRKSLLDIAKAGEQLVIQGEGWEDTPLCSMNNVEFLNPRPMNIAIEQMGNFKRVLDICPGFTRGIHDRVTSAAMNGCEIYNAHMEQIHIDPKEYTYEAWIRWFLKRTEDF